MRQESGRGSGKESPGGLLKPLAPGERAMTTQRVALLVAVLFAGLFAGLMFTFSVVIERVMRTLSASEYTKVMQGLIRGADIPPIVPAVVVIAFVAPLV